MAPFTILEDQLEDDLHAKRLLRVEERPLERIKSRLLGPTTPISNYIARGLSKTASGNDEGTPKESSSGTTSSDEHTKFLKDIQRFRDDVILDFAAFEASLARIQFLRDANEKERQRYAAEKVKIQATAQEVRDDTARLKTRLEEAKNTLEVRKGYDILAEKITKDARLKPRDEQHLDIERLRVEIEELEREGVELGNAWVDRREQFSRVMEEGTKLRRIVRDEKDPELDNKGENSEDEGDQSEDDNENMLGVERQRDEGSNVGTPRPVDDAPTPLPPSYESGAMTPRSTLADAEIAGDRSGAPGINANQDMEMGEEQSEDQGQDTLKAKVADEMDVS